MSMSIEHYHNTKSVCLFCNIPLYLPGNEIEIGFVSVHLLGYEYISDIPTWKIFTSHANCNNYFPCLSLF